MCGFECAASIAARAASTDDLPKGDRLDQSGSAKTRRLILVWRRAFADSKWLSALKWKWVTLTFANQGVSDRTLSSRAYSYRSVTTGSTRVARRAGM
jgi:hypothetical protein